MDTSFVSEKDIKLDADRAIREDRKIRKFRFFDALFRRSVSLSSLLFVIVIAGIFFTLLVQSLPR
jgi:hypothetical protein